MNLIGAGIETPKTNQDSPSSGKALQFPFLFASHSIHAWTNIYSLAA